MFRRVLNRNKSWEEDSFDERPNQPSRTYSSSNPYSNGNVVDDGPEISIPRSRMRSFADRMTRQTSTTTRKRGRRPGRSPIRPVTRPKSPLRDTGGRSVVSAATDLLSISTTITVETTRTRDNENRKPIPTYQNPQHYHPNNRDAKNHQVFCNRYNAKRELKFACNDSAVNQIYCKDLEFDKNICSLFLSLIRGDNKSWEVMAVDILRQKSRWENITFEECSNNDKSTPPTPPPTTPKEVVAAPTKKKNSILFPQDQEKDQYLEVCISFIISLDNCANLHLSNLVLQQPFTLQSLTFAKHLTKLQFDLMDLSMCIPTLCHCLMQNKSLETLITSRCGLNDEQLAALLSSIPDQLLELRVFGNKCRQEGLAAATSLIQTHPKLEILDLSYQHLTKREKPEDDKEFDISWLMVALLDNTTLLTLDLDNTAIDDEDMRHIVNALCENSTLEEIMLNHNFITNEGVALLSSRFNDMNGLKKISMYSNLFDPPTIEPPPTEISTPTSISDSVTTRSINNTEKKGQNRGKQLGDFLAVDEEASDDDRTVNTAISSLADDTVFQLMEAAAGDMPPATEEVPQEPYRADPNAPRSSETTIGDNNFFRGNSAAGQTIEQRHYFNDDNDYDESVCPTEYEEVSVYTEVEESKNEHDYQYPSADSFMDLTMDSMDDELMPEPVPDADFVRSNTTTF